MNDTITLLIADRNPRVRKYLEREMTAAGYRVYLAENGRQVFFWLNQSVRPDLLIVDPDFTDQDTAVFFRLLRRCSAAIPVVIHSHEDMQLPEFFHEKVWFVPKEGDSIRALMRAVIAIVAQTRLQ